MKAIPSGSTAVMARRVEPPDSLDFFPTPPWAVRALCAHVAQVGGHSVWDPACGDGAMLGALGEYARHVSASDVHDYGRGYTVHDFLQPYLPYGIDKPSWIITNPPFRLAERFLDRALDVADHVALLVRTSFLEGTGRFKRIFNVIPPVTVAQFSERVPMFRGRLDDEGSTATAYCWMVWRAKGAVDQTRLMWIRPCRNSLERLRDYDERSHFVSRETSATPESPLFPPSSAETSAET